MVLSILIATVPGRESVLSRLLWTIQQQLVDGVEVLVFPDWIPFGDKVNYMRKVAKGDFSVVVDDDDLLTADYVAEVLPHLTDGIDYLDYGILYTIDGKYSDAIYSEGKAHHKCLVRNDRAKAVPLGNAYEADRQWTKYMGQLKTTTLRKCLYIYDYSAATTVGTEPSDSVPEQRDVGLWPYNRELFTWLSPDMLLYD